MRALLLSLLGGLFLLPAHAQKTIKLYPVEHKLDSARHYKRILIVGEGGMQSRMYLDNLSVEIIKELKKQQIECKYEYLGDRSKVNTEVALQKAKTWEHDAILKFYPFFTDEQPTNTDVANPIYWRMGDPSKVVQQYMVSDYEITLNEPSGKVWSAKLHSVVEFGRPVYKRIRKLILNDLEKQNVLVL